MAVLLTILKITGIVILAVLALLLLIALIVLFVPVRYSIRAEKGPEEDTPYAKIGVTFLLHIISAGFVYDGDTDRFVKVFGIRVYPKKEKPRDTEEASAPVPDPKEQENGPKPQGAAEEAVPEYTVDWNEEPEDISDEYLSRIFGIADEDTESDDTSGADNDLWEKAEALIEKITDKYTALSEKYERSKKKIEYWKKAYNDKRNRKAAEHIKNVLIHVLKKAAPKRVKGFVHFGTDDPGTTGMILAFCGIIYPVLPRKLVIEPDFEESLIYGDLYIKGRLALIVVGVAFLKLILDKDCRRMWNIYKKGKSQ